jgi:UDP-N-acetylmuramoylalanine--D-glutamate ligase
MGIESIAKEMNQNVHGGLAAIDTALLKKMRQKAIRDCFIHMDEMPHKMEFVARIQGKRFVDDASSNTVNSTWYAMESTDGPIIWIAEGSEKAVDYKMLVKAAEQKIKMLICLGESSRLREYFEGKVDNIVDCDTMKQAVTRALYNELETATVLYSPAVDNEKDMEDSAKEFKHEVAEL